MRVRLNDRKKVRLNTGNVKANLYNETRIKMFGTPGSLVPVVDGDFRLLEDNDFRLLEDGDFRILE